MSGTTINDGGAIPHLKPDSRGVRRVDFHAMGTACTIQFRHADDETSLRFLSAALGWLSRFEARFSRYRTDSLISRINQAAGREWVNVDTEMEHLLDISATLHSLTDGILDPTMLPLLRIWDWKTVHAKLPEKAAISEARKLTGFSKLQRKPGKIFLPLAGMGLDFGGFGKEYAVDEVVRIAREHGIHDALVDLGRDIYGMGGNGQHPFWHVGLENARNLEQCWGGLAVSEYAVAASGDYVRRFEHNGKRYGHIIDPRSGWPVANGMLGVTVLAPTCLQAGIYSTAMFVMGPEEGLRFATCAVDVEACIQTETGAQATHGFVRRQVQAA